MLWIYRGNYLLEPPENSIGFVYEIIRINLLENNTKPFKYIGKKQFFGKGKTNKNKESDWNNYYGSSNLLLDDIKLFGNENFERHIIEICYSYSELAWKEVMHQIDNHVLSYDVSSCMPKKYYNGNIFGKFYKDKIFVKEDLTRTNEYITESVHHNAFWLYITDGKNTTKIHTIIEDINSYLVNNPTWRIGSTVNGSYIDHKIAVTDGDITLYINVENLYQFLLENKNFYKGHHLKGTTKILNNGIIEKRMLSSEIPVFLSKNIEWNEGKLSDISVSTVLLHNYKTFSYAVVPVSNKEQYFSQGWEYPTKDLETMYIWISKNGIDKKIDSSINIPDGWDSGKTIDSSDGLIIRKNGKYKCISNNIDSYIKKGWLSVRRHRLSKHIDYISVKDTTKDMIIVINTDSEKTSSYIKPGIFK